MKLYLFLILILLSATITTTTAEHYLLSCGAAPAVSDTPSTYDGQIWYSDNNSTFSSDFSSTVAAAATNPAFNVPPVPFSTARIFTGNFTYSFPVSPGPIFVRLFFYPNTTYSNFSSSDSFLNLRSNSGHVLLRNFSAYLSNPSYTFKEFYVHVTTSPLQLTFSPTTTSSHAFLNGIEIVSVPENLYVGPTPPENVANKGIQFDLSTSTAMETAYRLNVGGNDVTSNDDSGKMYRHWVSDENFLTGGFSGSTGLDGDENTIRYTSATPNYTAPEVVYRSFRWMGRASEEVRKKVNVTWEFEVDLGFFYLVRLHWCEVTVVMNASNDRVFSVYIDHLMAEDEADVFAFAAGDDTPIYRDYVVYMDDRHGSQSRGLLQLAMHPNDKLKPTYLDILLNGLEIFKLSRTDGSLDAPNPTSATATANKPPPFTKSHSHILPVVIGGAVAGTVLLAGILFCIFIIISRRKRANQISSGSSISTTSDSKKQLPAKSEPIILPSDLCRRFSVTEIIDATSNFSDSLIIGRGGFGNVYKGTIDGDITVAIKRLNPLSKQGAREFTTEIQMLSKLRHVNLVSLVGFCDDAGEMILVYEYMPHGTLRDHIVSPQLTWLQKLEICVGAARGLHYLHSDAGQMVIHRDVKSTNILLDENWVAKMSDFGLSKLGPTGSEISHVSTAVKGSFGYVDPEYYRRQQLTEKSDVYSFGVVLFEVLCGRAVLGPGLPKDQVNVAVWGRRNQLRGALEAIVDPSLKREIAGECLRKFGEVAESCVREQGVERPSMADVVWGLEFALQLQKEAKEVSNGVEGDVGMTIDSESESDYKCMSTESSKLFSGISDQVHSTGLSSSVFSQILNPEGR